MDIRTEDFDYPARPGRLASAITHAGLFVCWVVAGMITTVVVGWVLGI